MGYTVGLILGSYGCCELAWELYLRVKEGGIHIRPNEEVVPLGTSDEDGRALWVTHCRNNVGENYKGYFIIQEDNIDKFKIYVGEFGTAAASYSFRTREIFYIVPSDKCGLNGSITGTNSTIASSVNQITTNTISVNSQGGQLVNHYTCIYICSMNGDPVAYIPLSWYNNSFLKTEGSGDSNYNAHTYKKAYSHVVKVITNNTVKIVEISHSGRSQSLSGQIVIGYIKGIGLTWVTNDDDTNWNIGNTVGNHILTIGEIPVSVQCYPTFYPNPTQIYMQHMLPYKYSGKEIEYLTQKLFVSGQYPPSTKTIFQAYTAIDGIYDCNNINDVAVPGSRISMDGIVYYVIENSIIPIGEVEE